VYGECPTPNAGAGGHQRQFNRLEIAKLSDQNDIRILTQSATQGRGKAFGVDAHLAMVYQAVLAFMNELDRVLHSDNMVVPVLIGIIHHRRECCGFTRPVGPVTTTSPRWSMQNFFNTAGRGASNFQSLE